MHRAETSGAKDFECHVSGTPTPLVSVVIPVYNDLRRLEICLRALQNQDYPKDRYEVIVVDNGSDEDIDSVIRKFRTLQVRTVEEHRVGSYAARNRGISVARGEILAFTDSDCIPAPDWIRKGVKNLLRLSNPGLIAGRVQVFYKDPRKPTPVELYDQIFSFRVSEGIRNRKTGPTANMFAPRRVFARVGFFNERLKSRGDFEWTRRAYLAGYQLTYAGDVCVAHPARYSFGQIYRRTIRVEGGVHDFNRSHRHSVAGSVRGFSSGILRGIILVCLQRDLNWSQRLKVLIVMFSVKCVGIVERLRLTLGGHSKR